ncbi:Uncharacterised protein [Dermatophilus congolensis]|uniref:Uncharacterized protein n=1 Tax=Dermatophilus congolensis TaxID=1863 RepID=A0AA46H149_9MICO|nr:Uncharacterised protein [Dermatophilus congolensis]
MILVSITAVRVASKGVVGGVLRPLRRFRVMVRGGEIQFWFFSADGGSGKGNTIRSLGPEDP